MSRPSFGSPPQLACPNCQSAIHLESLQPLAEVPCPQCNRRLTVARFPQFFLEKSPTLRPEKRVADDDAACFFHPENRATLSCEKCGRFICSVCDLPLGAEHLCPACLTSGLADAKLPQLVTKRFIWSKVALALGFLPLFFGPLFFPLFIVTGSLCFYLAIASFRRPGSLTSKRPTITASIAILLAIIQLTVWAMMILGIFG